MIVLSKIKSRYKSFVLKKIIYQIKEQFSRKIKIKHLQILKKKNNFFFPSDTKIFENTAKLKSNLHNLIDVTSKILIKKTISLQDEEIFISNLTEINKMPLRNLENKFFENMFFENINRFQLNGTKSTIQLIIFLDKFLLYNNKFDFKIFEKKIHFNINVFDPLTIIRALEIYSRFLPENYLNSFKSFQIPIERIIDQFSVENLTKLFYLYSKINNDNLDFLRKINKQLILKQSKKEIFTNDDVSRVCIGILSKYTLNYDYIHPNIWAEINNNLMNDMKIYDLKKFSYNIYLLAKSSYYDKKLFDKIEKFVFGHIVDLKEKTNLSKNEDLIEKFEDISRIMCAFSVANKGSYALWHEYFHVCEFIIISEINFSSINQIIEILLNRGYLFKLFSENKEKYKLFLERIDRIVEKIEEKYLEENVFAEHCAKVNLKQFCESVIKTNLFSENFTNLCAIIIGNLLNRNKLNNNI